MTLAPVYKIPTAIDSFFNHCFAQILKCKITKKSPSEFQRARVEDQQPLQVYSAIIKVSLPELSCLLDNTSVLQTQVVSIDIAILVLHNTA